MTADPLDHAALNLARLERAAALAAWESQTAGAVAAAIRDQLIEHPPPSPSSRAEMLWVTWAHHLEEAAAAHPAAPADPAAD